MLTASKGKKINKNPKPSFEFLKLPWILWLDLSLPFLSSQLEKLLTSIALWETQLSAKPATADNFFQTFLLQYNILTLFEHQEQQSFLHCNYELGVYELDKKKAPSGEVECLICVWHFIYFALNPYNNPMRKLGFYFSPPVRKLRLGEFNPWFLKVMGLRRGILRWCNLILIIPHRPLGLQERLEYWKLKQLETSEAESLKSSLVDLIGPACSFLQTRRAFSVGSHWLGTWLLLPLVNRPSVCFQFIAITSKLRQGDNDSWYF